MNRLFVYLLLLSGSGSHYAAAFNSRYLPAVRLAHDLLRRNNIWTGWQPNPKPQPLSNPLPLPNLLKCDYQIIGVNQ